MFKLEKYDTKSLVMVLAIVLFINIVIIIKTNPNITGLVIQKESGIKTIEKSFNESTTLNLNLRNVRSLRINALFKGKGYAYGYIEINNKTLKIFDTRLKQKFLTISGMVVLNTTMNESINNTTNEANQAINQSVNNETQQESNQSLINNESIKEIDISNECLDTCIIYADQIKKLYINVTNGTLIVHNITYQYMSKQNNPPTQVKAIKPIVLNINESIKINLSQYFTDKDNDSLIYDHSSTPINIAINKDIAIINANKEGVYLLYFYVSDGKEVVKSNEFSIIVKSYQNNISQEMNKTRRNVLERLRNNRRISKELLKKLEKENTTRIIIQVKSKDYLRKLSLYTKLKDKPMPKVIKAMSQYIVMNATPQEIEALLSINDTELVMMDKKFRLMVNETKYIVRAIDTWNTTKGNGSRICLLDTGVDPSVVSYSNGYDFVNNDSSPIDDNGHGTMIAYIIKQLEPETEIVVAKVFNSKGESYASTILEGIDYCLQNNARIMSMSFGSGSYANYCDEDPIANKCLNESLICIAATGNDGYSNITAPSCGSKVISVASVDKNDKLSSFSNINNLTTILAPGQDIYTRTLNNQLIQSSGTSLAVPHISAAIAMLLSINDTMNSSTIKKRIVTTGKPINISGQIYPRIDFLNLLINNQTMNYTEINASQENLSNNTNTSYNISLTDCDQACGVFESTDCNSSYVCSANGDYVCECAWDDLTSTCEGSIKTDCSSLSSACIPGISTVSPYSCFSCGNTVSQEFNLTKDLTCSYDFLVVGADNIDIDCQGHKVTGSGSSPYKGINIGTHNNTNINDCFINSFYYGIYQSDGENTTLKSSTINNSYFAVFTTNTDNFLIEDSNFTSNTYDADLSTGTQNVIALNTSISDSKVTVSSGTFWFKHKIKMKAYNGEGTIRANFVGEDALGDETISTSAVSTTNWLNVGEYKKTSSGKTSLLPWSFNITPQTTGLLANPFAQKNVNHKFYFTQDGVTYEIYLFPCNGSFRVKDRNNNDLLIIDKYGEMWIRGNLTQDIQYCSDLSTIKFCLKNPSGYAMVGLETNGNLHQPLDYGGLSENLASITPAGNNDFIVKNRDGTVVAMIDEYGEIYLLREFLNGSNGYYEGCYGTDVEGE